MAYYRRFGLGFMDVVVVVSGGGESEAEQHILRELQEDSPRVRVFVIKNMADQIIKAKMKLKDSTLGRKPNAKEAESIVRGDLLIRLCGLVSVPCCPPNLCYPAQRTRNSYIIWRRRA